MKRPCVYILASQRNGTLFVGVTSDIVRRIWEHKTDAVDGFTRHHDVHRLVYLELHETMPEAILREKRVKKWRRAWKLALIERDNPGWRDLYGDILR
ncbi:MAG: GIY-YIG nuclease family protein [Acetobacteraceae bacterium]